MNKPDPFTKTHISQAKYLAPKISRVPMHSAIQRKLPVAPPVYRPQPTPKVLQRRIAPGTDNRSIGRLTQSTVIQRATWNRLPNDVVRLVGAHLNPVETASLRRTQRRTAGLFRAPTADHYRTWLQEGGLEELQDSILARRMTPGQAINYLREAFGNIVDQMPELYNLRALAANDPQPAALPANKRGRNNDYSDVDWDDGGSSNKRLPPPDQV
jgi:hypothetical protein